MSVTTTIFMQQCLQRLQVGDRTVREELMWYAHRRLKLLANRMFVRFPRLECVEEADDLLQEGMLRLWKSLDEVKPDTVAGFMGLAALHMRWSLRDLARKHFRRSNGNSVKTEARRPLNEIQAGFSVEEQGNSPDDMMSWSEFHEAADTLPLPERTCFDLVYYHGLPKHEVAAVMSISTRQVARYWQSARREILKTMDGFWPDL